MAQERGSDVLQGADVLKPCPFCGEPTKLTVKLLPECKTACAVYCSCGSHGPTAVSVGLAVGKWNARWNVGGAAQFHWCPTCMVMHPISGIDQNGRILIDCPQVKAEHFSVTP